MPLLLSPARRLAAAGALIAFAAFLVLAFGRGEGSSAEAGAAALRGDVRSCATLKGEVARECYAREVGRELAALGGGEPRVFAGDTSSTVTFAQGDTSAALLCDLHLRVGVTDTEKASWTTWSTQ